MNQDNFKTVKILLWDLDGTLYQSIPQLSQAMQQAFIKILQQHKSLDDNQAKTLFEETRKIHKSATRSLSALGCGDKVSIIKKIESLVDKASFLKIDHQLQLVFQQLYYFQHFLLSDSTHQTIIAELEALGLSHTIFNDIIGVDDIGTTKPDRKFFDYVLKQTGLPPNNHLIIGDRPEVDLLPAKFLGIKTCLVWSNQPLKGIDICLPTVYNVPDLFEKS